MSNDIAQRLLIVGWSFFMAVLVFVGLVFIIPNPPVITPEPAPEPERIEIPAPDFICADTLLRAPGGLYGNRATVCYDGYIWEERNTGRLNNDEYMRLIDPLRRQLLEEYDLRRN